MTRSGVTLPLIHFLRFVSIHELRSPCLTNRYTGMTNGFEHCSHVYSDGEILQEPLVENFIVSFDWTILRCTVYQLLDTHTHTKKGVLTNKNVVSDRECDDKPIHLGCNLFSDILCYIQYITPQKKTEI